MAKIIGSLNINVVKEIAQDSIKFSAVTSSEMIAGAASIAAYTSKDIVSKAAHGSTDLLGASMDTVNRYTKDLLDVGDFGKSDLSSDMGSLVAGTAAMGAVNAVRMAKTPLKYAQIGTANLIYSKERLSKTAEESAGRIVKNREAALNPYWNLAVGKTRNSAVNGFGPRTRYLDLNLREGRIQSIKDRYAIGKAARMTKRKDFLVQSAKNYRTFNLVRSSKDMAKNQTRKTVSLIVNGNNPEGMENRAGMAAYRSFRSASRLQKPLGKSLKASWGIVKATGKMIRHPIRTFKAAGHMITHVVTTIVSTVTSALVSLLSGLFSMIVALMPILVAICAVIAVVAVVASIVSFIAGIFTEPPAKGGYWQDIKICDTGNSTKSYAGAAQAWLRESDQSRIFNCYPGGHYACGAGTPPPTGNTIYGELKKDPELGLYYYEIDGDKYYTNAVASYYSTHIGDRFRVTTDTGAVFHIIVADQKADPETVPGNACDAAHCKHGHDGSMLEFYVDRSIWEANGPKSVNQDFGDGRNFSGAVTKMEKWVEGSGAAGVRSDGLGAPDFSNRDAWRYGTEGGKNPYGPPLTSPYYGQCTWGAWGKFYEIYGYSPGFTGPGSKCVSELIATHPDKFEYASKPVAGSVYSGVTVNHVGIVLGVNGNTVTLFDANLNYVSDPWEVAITDWVIWDKTLDQLHNDYGGVVFANPK